MWLFTTIGFYSIVQKPGDHELTIRSRDKDDLRRLRETYMPALGEIIEGAGTDYQFRAKIGFLDFAQGVSRLAQDIDYSNFKAEVEKRRGVERAGVYHDVWAVLIRAFGKRSINLLI